MFIDLCGKCDLQDNKNNHNITDLCIKRYVKNRSTEILNLETARHNNHKTITNRKNVLKQVKPA